MTYRTAAARAAIVLLAAAAVALAIAGWMRRVPATYFPAAEVDRRAYPVRDIGLAFPKGREAVDYYGTLRMDVRIDEHGVVTRVDVLESSVPPAFREQAVRAFLAARFVPAEKGGRSVRSVKRVEVRFAAPVRSLEATTPPSDR